MPNPIPAHLRSALGRLNDTVAELDTRIARANEIPVPEMEPVDPKVVEQYANSPDAPAPLKAVAKAVAEGRTSWAEVLAGGGRDVPEVRDLQAASAVQLEREMQKQLDDEAAGDTSAPPPASPPRARQRRWPADDEDEDFSDQTFLR
ncbi:MAG: hypothetical protein GEU98_07890 [Pseudonocardiaceae bacterium]|nr:hypothetical protein [Pseudonocardiaceae bacterium]